MQQGENAICPAYYPVQCLVAGFLRARVVRLARRRRGRTGETPTSRRSGLWMDELDRRVVAALRVDPRISYAALGKQLGVSGMTAATRLNRLRASGMLICSAEPNLALHGLTTEVLG